MMPVMNCCDGGHETLQPVRLLPIGGGGGVYVCHEHYMQELDSRISRNRTLLSFDAIPLPEWTDLESAE